MFTIAWMSVEAALSLWAAWTAHSPVLAGFGGDSAIELMSAAIVLWRFRTLASEHAEQRAAHIAGGLLAVLAVYVVLASVMSLLGYGEPRPSDLGMAVLAERSAYHAGPCQGETASIRSDRQCCSTSRRCRICFVRLPRNHCSYGSRGSCNLAHCMGRPGCSIGNHSADRGRGSEGYARQGLRLLLATNPHTSPTLMDGALLRPGPTRRLAAADSSDKNFRGETEFVSGEGSCHPERNAGHTSSVQA